MTFVSYYIFFINSNNMYHLFNLQSCARKSSMKTIFLLVALGVLTYNDCETKGINALDGETYEVICQLVRGSFTVPRRMQTRKELNACLHYWRNKASLSLDENGHLRKYGRRILKKSELEWHVKDAFHRSKGSGVRKIKHRLANEVCGVSEAYITRVLRKSTTYQLLQARFNNTQPLKPIRASAVQKRHQIDLINLNKYHVLHGGKIYRYVLSVMDVFSRYLWLKPLTSKESSEVARALLNIYIEHGPPTIIQHDRGGEFRRSVSKLMQKLSVRVIMSAPYHPETQGKVERSHRSFRIKLKFDLVTFKKRGVNWVNNLQRYAASLNDDAREELKWRTPFEVYFGRKNNILVAPLRVDPNAVCTENRRPGPTKTSDYDKFNDCQNKIRKAAGKASKRCADRMVKRSSRKNPPSIYNAKDRVLIRLKDRKHHVPRKYHVLPGTVLEANYKSNRYRVQFISPQTDRLTSQWFPVTDITSTTNLKERQRKLQSQKVQHRKKYIIELTHSDRISAFGIGLSVRLDPVGDGNCQFAAFADQLNLAGIHRSAATLRDEIVQDLRRNPFNQAGIHLGHYVDRNDWEHYLNHMEVEGSYGDHLTIQRASEIFNVYIVIYSSLGPQGTNVISPNGRFERGLPTMFLGHLAEEQGEHYLSLTNPGLDSVDNELNRFRNQTHTDSHPVNTQSPPCAASLDQESTESTVIPSIYQQSPPCAASFDQESTESTVIPSTTNSHLSKSIYQHQQSPPCAASLDQESTESTVIPSIYQQSPPCAASFPIKSLLSLLSSRLSTNSPRRVPPLWSPRRAQPLWIKSLLSLLSSRLSTNSPRRAQPLWIKSLLSLLSCRLSTNSPHRAQPLWIKSLLSLSSSLDQESSIYQQSPPCAASFDQESTESTVMPSIYQQSPPCAASLDQESTESTVIPSIYQQSPPCAASFDQESTESTVMPSIYQQSPPCPASLDQQSPIVIPERHELPHLPPEILKIILQRTLELDCTMIGIFEQVSDHFKELVSHMRPLLHIGDSLAERLGIVACREKCVSVRSIHRAAGRNSGLVQLIRKLLRENIKNWMNAWLMLTAEDYSKYSISHIFRK